MAKYGGKLASVPEEPVDATVVATVIPVAEFEVNPRPSNLSPDGPDEETPFVPNAAYSSPVGDKCRWLGSVTVDVAVCVWLTVTASLLPPLAAIAYRPPAPIGALLV